MIDISGGTDCLLATGAAHVATLNDGYHVSFLVGTLFAESDLHRQGSAAIGALQAEVSEDLHQALGLHVLVQVVEPHHLPRNEGKVKRVVDRRQLT